MRQFIFIFTFLFSYGALQSQTAGQLSATGSQGTGYSQALINQMSGDIETQEDILARSTGIDEFAGSPYINDEFQPVNVYYENELMDNLYYRYNALNEEIEIKNTQLEEEAPQRLLADKAIHLDVNGKKLGFKTFIDKKNNTLNGYLTLLIDGPDYDLYRRVRVKFTEGQKAQNSFVMAVPNRFTHFIEYYYQEEGVNRIDELKSTNSGFLKILPNETKGKMKAYLKDKDLNLKEEQDLIKAFEFLNNLNENS